MKFLEKHPKLSSFIDGIKNLLNKGYRNNISALSGQSTFFLILSIIPLVMFVFAMYSVLTGKTPQALEIPEQYRDIPLISTVYKYLYDAAQRSTSGTAIITAVLALWSAGRGLFSITDGISRIYRLPQKMWLVRRLSSMGYTAIMLVIFLLSFALLAGDVYFSNVLADSHELSEGLRTLIPIAEYLFAAAVELFILTLALKLFLRRKVDKRYTTFRALLPGMLFTVAGWCLLEWGVRLYLTYFSTSSLYGSLGTVAILMTEIYFSMMILLYGVQLNFLNRERFSSSNKKSTG